MKLLSFILAILLPVQCWAQTPKSIFAKRLTINNLWTSSGSRTNILLNTAYVHGTSGNAVAIQYHAITADPINEVYFFLDAHGGTIGNITCSCVIYNENSALKAGTTARATASSVTIPAANTKWIKCSFSSPYTPSVGEILWIVIANTSASPTVDYPQILTGVNSVIAGGVSNAIYGGVSTTSGFSTNGTTQQKASFIVKQGSNYFGQPITQQAIVYSSNTRKRGIVVKTGSASVSIFGIEYGLPAGATSGIQIFTSSQLPGDTPVQSYNLGSDTNQVTDELFGAKVLSADFTFAANSTYYVVLTFASNTTLPGVGQIEDYTSQSTIFDAMYDDFNVCHSIIDNGSNGWTEDRSISPAIQLLVSGFSGGSGGAPVFAPGGVFAP